MNRDALKQLRLDRRLINRRTWIAPSELERELESLPDVSGKAAPDEGEKEEGPAPAPQETPVAE